MDKQYLDEAIYLLTKYSHFEPINDGNFKVSSNLPSNILNAVLRILFANNLLNYENNIYYASKQNIFDINEINNSLNELQFSPEIMNLTDRLNEKKHNPFFKDLSEIEYEIYARYDYPISFELGKQLVSIIDFKNSDILDLGGNSGGLASAIGMNNTNSNLTVVDKSIPCLVGEEFKSHYNIKNVNFITDDLFTLKLNKHYDYIILANILHDYDDIDCQKILTRCKNHSKSSATILILEDILDSDNNPTCVVEHGLRLSINTLEGRQRTVLELNKMLGNIGFNFKAKSVINDVQSVIAYVGND